MANKKYYKNYTIYIYSFIYMYIYVHNGLVGYSFFKVGICDLFHL